MARAIYNLVEEDRPDFISNYEIIKRVSTASGSLSIYEINNTAVLYDSKEDHKSITIIGEGNRINETKDQLENLLNIKLEEQMSHENQLEKINNNNSHTEFVGYAG